VVPSKGIVGAYSSYKRKAGKGMAFRGFGNGFGPMGIHPMERETINRVAYSTGINVGASLGIKPDLSYEDLRERECSNDDWTMDFEGRGPEDH
jgi:hypothetical protein